LVEAATAWGTPLRRTECARRAAGLLVTGQIAQKIMKELASPLGVTSDKTHIEYNETALILIADMSRDMDFCCNGPTSDVERFTRSPRSRLRAAPAAR
jgi:hypothetical protein